MTHDRLTQIERLRLHVTCELSEPCLDSLLDEVDNLEAQNAKLLVAAAAVYRSDLKHDAYDEILALVTEDQNDERT